MYKHKIVQGLYDLIETYGGKGGDPMMKALWFGIKGEVPFLLQTLDSNEDMIAEIESKLREVLGIPTETPSPVEPPPSGGSEATEVGDAELEIKVTPPEPEEKPPDKPKKKKRKRKASK